MARFRTWLEPALGVGVFMMSGTISVRRQLVGARASVVASMVVLAGCAGMTPQLVSPTLDGEAVARSVGEHQKLITALQSDAEVLGYASADWYEVSLAGFNYVDDQCAVYFDSLFAFNRRTSATKSALSAFGQTTSAILEITGAASATMAIIAQAFGLASAMTDVVAGTFLYELPPANTKKFVEKVMTAYKKKASDERGSINSRSSAYSAVRGYLNLCLPVTIEGQLIEHISDAVAEAKDDGSGTNIEVGTRSVRPSDLITSPDIVLPPVFTAPAEARGRNPYEQGVHPEQWKTIQLAICATVDGDPGDATHAAMAEFFAGYGEPDPGITTRGIGPEQMEVLLRAVEDANGQTCTQRNVANARAAGARL